MSLEQFDTRDVNGVLQNKGLRLRDFATLCGAPFYYPIRKVTTCEPVSPYTQSREVTRPTREVRTRSRILEAQEEHSRSL